MKSTRSIFAHVFAAAVAMTFGSDHFLVRAEKESSISTSRRFHAVKLADKAIFEFPLLIMTSEGTFRLYDRERENLRRYVERGGMLFASAGCSSSEWGRSFRAEMATVFPDNGLKPIAMEHPMFHTVYAIDHLEGGHGQLRPLVGVSIGGRLGVVYSPDGLNDTAHTQGCCGGGGNEIGNAEQINVNILAYTLTY